MKNSMFALVLGLTLAAPFAFAHEDAAHKGDHKNCACTEKCMKHCKDHKGKKCDCKSCDCSKSGKCGDGEKSCSAHEGHEDQEKKAE